MDTNAGSVISRIAGRKYKADLGRNRAAIIAIILTTVMFTVIFTAGFSLVATTAAMGAAGVMEAQTVLIMIAAVIIILISGYLIIYNIFNISVSKDIRFFGLMKTLGASKRQVMSIVMRQAMKLCLIGIPVGLGIGYAAGALLLPVLLAQNSALAVLSVHPALFICAAVFALITVLISCGKPAGEAAKVSPIEAMGHADGGVEGGRQKKHGKNGATISKMALTNLSRNKKRTALVIVSLSLGLMLTNGFFVMQQSYDPAPYIESFIGSDIAISDTAASNDMMEYDGNISAITPEMEGLLTSAKGAVETGSVYYTKTAVKPGEGTKRIEKFYKSDGPAGWLESSEEAMQSFEGLLRTGEVTAGVYGMDAFPAGMGNWYLGQFDKEKFDAGGYAIGMGIADNGEGSVFHEVGDKIEIGGNTYEIMGMVDPPRTVQGSLEDADTALGIKYAINSTDFKSQLPGVPVMAVFADFDSEENRLAAEAALHEHTKENQDVSITTVESITGQFGAQVAGQTVLGFTLGAVMAIIGVLNFINSMYTAIMARRREFAMLESIGMTGGQLKKMLVFEGIDYAVIALILSYVLGALFSLTVIQELISTSWTATFSFTMLPLVFLTPLIIGLAVLIAKKCFESTRKQPLIERLRAA